MGDFGATKEWCQPFRRRLLAGNKTFCSKLFNLSFVLQPFTTVCDLRCRLLHPLFGTACPLRRHGYFLCSTDNTSASCRSKPRSTNSRIHARLRKLSFSILTFNRRGCIIKGVERGRCGGGRLHAAALSRRWDDRVVLWVCT